MMLPETAPLTRRPAVNGCVCWINTTSATRHGAFAIKMNPQHSSPAHAAKQAAGRPAICQRQESGILTKRNKDKKGGHPGEVGGLFIKGKQIKDNM